MIKGGLLFFAVVAVFFAIFFIGPFIHNPAKEQARKEVQACIKSNSECTMMISDFQERYGENP